MALPGSIAVMETHGEAATINGHLCELEGSGGLLAGNRHGQAFVGVAAVDDYPATPRH